MSIFDQYRTLQEQFACINDPLGIERFRQIERLFLADAEVVAPEFKKFLRPVEEQLIDSDYGHFGKHYIMLIPLFQHAWSEAGHDLGYKSSSDLTPHQRWNIAVSSAHAWDTDRTFDELHREWDGK
jgi:hypothetical protein